MDRADRRSPLAGSSRSSWRSGAIPANWPTARPGDRKPPSPEHQLQTPTYGITLGVPDTSGVSQVFEMTLVLSRESAPGQMRFGIEG